jgi:hypothetical protein
VDLEIHLNLHLLVVVTMVVATEAAEAMVVVSEEMGAMVVVVVEEGVGVAAAEEAEGVEEGVVVVVETAVRLVEGVHLVEGARLAAEVHSEVAEVALPLNGRVDKPVTKQLATQRTWNFKTLLLCLGSSKCFCRAFAWLIHTCLGRSKRTKNEENMGLQKAGVSVWRRPFVISTYSSSSWFLFIVSLSLEFNQRG